MRGTPYLNKAAEQLYQFEAAVESLKSRKPETDYTNAAYYAYENADVRDWLAQYADTQGDHLELGRRIAEDIDNMIKAACE